MLEVPREQVSRIVAELLSRFAVADITIDEVDVEEIIRDIFAGKGHLEIGNPVPHV